MPSPKASRRATRHLLKTPANRAAITRALENYRAGAGDVEDLDAFLAAEAAEAALGRPPTLAELLAGFDPERHRHPLYLDDSPRGRETL